MARRPRRRSLAVVERLCRPPFPPHLFCKPPSAAVAPTTRSTSSSRAVMGTRTIAAAALPGEAHVWKQPARPPPFSRARGR